MTAAATAERPTLTVVQTEDEAYSPTEGMTMLEKTFYHRARRAEKFATAFGGFFWEGDPRSITEEEWFDAADALQSLFPSPETQVGVIALLEVENGAIDQPAPDAERDLRRSFYTMRKAAKIANVMTASGVTDAREVSPRMWREVRIQAGLTSNEAPSNVTRAAITGIIDQRTAW